LGSGATEAKRPKGGGTDAKVLRNKRNYGQFHLDLGQPDFLLHMCAVCGMMYARGNDEDEKVHRAYHKCYSEGVPFKVRCAHSCFRETAVSVSVTSVFFL
jgi:N-acetyltransferase